MVAELTRQRQHGDFREPAAADVLCLWRKLAVMLIVIYSHTESGHGSGHSLAKRDLDGSVLRRIGGSGLNHEGNRDAVRHLGLSRSETCPRASLEIPEMLAM